MQSSDFTRSGIFARNLKRRSSPKETVIVLYYYSREQQLANEENPNQRHLVTIACEALLMTMVMSALCKHIQKANTRVKHTRTHITHMHTETHTHTHASVRSRAQTHTQAHTSTQRHTQA